MKRCLLILPLSLLVCFWTQAQDSNVYEVYAIEYAVSSSCTPVKSIALNVTTDDSVLFSFYVWYLKGNNGRQILVDTGFLPDTGKPTPRFKRFDRLDADLQKIQVNPDDITDVIITHTHSDHVGGLELFPKAQLWMQKNDYAYYVGDAWQKGADHKGLDKRFVLPLVSANMDGRLHLINGDSVEFIPGIRAFIGSRHTFESQHVLVATKTDKVMLASDDSWFYYNVEHIVPIVLTFDSNAYTAALKRMRTLVDNPELIIPGHDSQVLSRFPQVAPGVVKIR
jgi:glyoxylase-like metal-dependent hydrolase (beta-lactamase superfamily II)